MPDLFNRHAHERALGTAIARVFSRWQDRELSPSALAADLAAVIRDPLAAAFADAAGQLDAQLRGTLRDRGGDPGDPSPDRFSGVAAAWVGQFADRLAAEIAGSTTAGDPGSFSRARAINVAITETTRAATAGERHATLLWDTEQKQALAAGVALVLFAKDGQRIWHTEHDASVCPVCRPLHNQPAEVWQRVSSSGPPAHPRCRCWLDYTFPV